MKKTTSKNSEISTPKSAKKEAAKRVKNAKLEVAKAAAKNMKKDMAKRRNTGKPKIAKAKPIAKKKEVGYINNLILAAFIIVLASLPGKKDDGQDDDKPLRTFTKKEKDELLKRVKDGLKKAMAPAPDNMYKVNLDFIILGRSAFKTFIENVIIKVGESVNYPSPVPILSDITDMVALEAVTRNAKQYNTANQYLKMIKDMMRKLCVYIANTCDNNLDTLESAGVRANITKRGPKVKASKAKINKVKDTKFSGEAKVTVDDVHGMQGLMGRWMNQADDKEVWVSVPFSLGVNILFTGMPKGATVWLQVCFKSSEGVGDWSISMEWVVR